MITGSLNASNLAWKRIIHAYYFKSLKRNAFGGTGRLRLNNGYSIFKRMKLSLSALMSCKALYISTKTLETCGFGCRLLARTVTFGTTWDIILYTGEGIWHFLLITGEAFKHSFMGVMRACTMCVDGLALLFAHATRLNLFGKSRIAFKDRTSWIFLLQGMMGAESSLECF